MVIPQEVLIHEVIDVCPGTLARLEQHIDVGQLQSILLAAKR